MFLIEFYSNLKNRKLQMEPTTNKKRIRFSPEDDCQLKELVFHFGEDWTFISFFMEGKNARQVKDRYKNYLSPKINRNPWTAEEDELLRVKIHEMGKKWHLLLEFFSHRTDTDLKNRWKLLERSQQKKKPINYQIYPSEDLQYLQHELNQHKKKFWEDMELEFDHVLSESNSTFW